MQIVWTKVTGTKDFIYKKAGKQHLELLATLRVMVLKAANRLPETTAMENVRRLALEYYRNSLRDDSHMTYLVFNQEDSVVGCGGISFYQVLPTYHNPSGKRAYIMNMYTQPDFRKRGIGKTVLGLLVEEAKRRGILQIGLETTHMGRTLYKKNGFASCPAEMEYHHP